MTEDRQDQRTAEIKRQEMLLELELHKELNKPRTLGKTELLICGTVVAVSLLNVVLNILTLGPDIFQW